MLLIQKLSQEAKRLIKSLVILWFLYSTETTSPFTAH